MSSTIAPSEEDKRDLCTLANNVPFDGCINHEAEVSDLSLTLIKEYLHEVGSSLYVEADTLDFPSCAGVWVLLRGLVSI